MRGSSRSHETGLRPPNLGATKSPRLQEQHLAFGDVSRPRNSVIALLRLPFEHLELCHRRLTCSTANLERNSLIRHDLLQVQPDCIAQLEAAGSQNPGGIRLEISIDSGAYDFVFHGYSVATFFDYRK